MWEWKARSEYRKMYWERHKKNFWHDGNKHFVYHNLRHIAVEYFQKSNLGTWSSQTWQRNNKICYMQKVTDHLYPKMKFVKILASLFVMSLSEDSSVTFVSIDFGITDYFFSG